MVPQFLNTGTGVTSASRPNKTSLIMFPHNNNLASTHGQECLCGGHGIQHHSARDVRGVSPTCASDNRRADLGPGCGTCSGLGTNSSPSWPLSHNFRSPGKHCHRQPLIEERAFVEAQASSTPLGKKYQCRCMGENNRNSLSSLLP